MEDELEAEEVVEVVVEVVELHSWMLREPEMPGQLP